MRLEEALQLKKGTILVATGSWVAPELVTEGKNYVMQEDARPIVDGIHSIFCDVINTKSKKFRTVLLKKDIEEIKS